jgi:aryl-alcohol dehydrogenase-like predicted oxidoreductase
MKGSRLVFGSADLRDDGITGKLLDQFYDAGGRSLDVANVYAGGESARAVGAWLASRGVRDDVVLYAKGCHPPYCSPTLVTAEVDKAVGDLGVDQLDIFMLHRDDPDVPVEEFAEALVEQVENGKLAGFGVSNWTMPRFRALAGCLDSARDQLVVFSNHFSLGEMVTPTWPGCLAMTKQDLDELAGSGVQALAWASLASGYFAGREVPSWGNAGNNARRERASELAKEFGVSPAAVALSYVLHQPPHVLAAVGTRSPAHLAEALSARHLRLTQQQLGWLETG